MPGPSDPGIFVSARIPLIGQRFERLVVLEQAPKGKGTAARWLCRCDCGKEKVCISSHLRGGRIRSCGCLRQETTARLNRTHGLSRRSPEYSCWLNMRNRCKNPLSRDYHNYGGRGISVDPRWDDFTVFLADMGHKPAPRSTIERVDNSRGYEPGNCQWLGRLEQSRNRRSCIYVESQGQHMTLREAAKRAGVPYGTAYHRYRRGRPMERVLTSRRLPARVAR